MTRKIWFLACAALLLGSGAAEAQLLRGGGAIGLGGGLGGLGGGVTGSVTTTLGRAGGDLDGAVSATDSTFRGRRIKPPKLPAGPVVRQPLIDGRVTAAVTGRLDGVNRVIPGGRVIAVPAIEAPAIGGIVVQRRQALINDGVAFVPYAEAPDYIARQQEVLDHELAGTGVEVHRRGQQIFIEMPSDVTFAFDKYDIQPRFDPVLSAVARTINQFPATYVDIVGHTDAIGSYSYNQVLSERRAESVADFLVGQHALSDRFYVEGRGKTEPIASNATIDGRAANRRVEIILTPFEGPA